ncbi:MAG: methylmalonyl-CoA mutase small subunit [Mariniphaga sp.]|nr:methylmalonyl-CoA mutase small subunit [Mariniphaga sp.]
MNEKDIKLFSEFPPVSTEAWEAQITTDLKGKDYDKTLVWRTNEGINVRPYYRDENLKGLDFVGTLPGQFPYVRGNRKAGNNWLVRQDIEVVNFGEANQKALDILSKGATSLGFVFKNCQEISVDDLKKLLQGICLEKTEVNFVMDCKNLPLVKSLVAFLKDQKANPDEVKASVNFDPIGVYTLKGKFCSSETEVFTRAKEVLESAAEYKSIQLIGVNGKNFNNAGASIVQELGFSLAIGAEYLTRLTESGLNAGVVAPRIKFNFGVGGNYFMEIAKLRAARMLWANIVKAYKPECNCGPDCNCEENGCGDVCVCAGRMHVHTETSIWNKTIYDPYVNLLRTETEAMSATLGGTDSLTIRPFDAVYEQPSEFAERIARNQQSVLKDEAHFDKIADPAAGSYYIETLTASIAEQAWKLFLEIQEKGGFIAAFREGFVQAQVNEMAAKRIKAVATRRENLLGVNQFPNYNEQITDNLNSQLFEAVDQTDKDAEVETIKFYRSAQQLEAMRYKTDCFSAKNKRPKAFMLTIGSIVFSKARAQFASNFFAVAGYKVVDNNAFETVEDGVKAALEAKADIVVICSSDEEYAGFAPEAFNQLKGKAIFVVAGAPACMDDLKAAGIENFISVKTNLLEALTAYNNKLGIK